MNRKGFTLIELLVVISIIALLLSIIMPSLNKAKMYAEEILCKSNMHQYHIATELYAAEQDEEYPSPWFSLYKRPNPLTAVLEFPGETERYCRWHNPEFNLEANPEEYGGPYWPYLAAGKAHVCPTFKKYARRYGGAHYNTCIGAPYEVQFSYSMNATLVNRDDAAKGVKKSQIASSPSQTFLWAEENMWRLDGFSNHVLNDNALLVDSEANPADCFGSYHKISKGKLSAQQPTAPGGSGVYNGGVANVLFMDGSNTYATPEDSVRYKGRLR